MMKKNYLFILMFVVAISVNAQVAINSDNSSPDGSAMLDVKSTDSGLLIPRMTTDERDGISSPATGLVVYVTEDANANPVNTFYYYDGTTWVSFQQGSKAWLLDGNAGTDGSQFVGTTDAQPLILKTDNTERVRIKENGVIGINVTPDDNYLISAESDAHKYLGHLVNKYTSTDGYGIYAICSDRDFFGYGGYFKGGYIGVYADVTPTGDNYYYGVKTNVSGGSGNNYGNFTFVSGDGTNYGNYSYVSGDGVNRGFFANISGAGTNHGVYSIVSGGDTNYAFYSISDIENGKGALAYLSNSNDTGTGIYVLGSNVSTYSWMNEGQAIAATGKKYTITAFSEEDDDDTVVVYAKYKGTTQTDATGLLASSVPADNYGYGIRAYGGYMGVYGRATNGFAGVYGSNAGNSSYGVYSYGDMRAIGNLTVSNDATISGDLQVDGDMNADGTKSFIIDHPLDPEHKFLKHFSIESDEVLNIYRGNIVLNAQGKAIVQLPSYFHAVNKNFSYTLTPVGSAAPNLFIEKEIDENGNFTIAGGQAGQKISWYVYAERNDPYLQQNPEKRQVEILKNDDETGKYLRPELYGQPVEKAIHYVNDIEKKSNEISDGNMITKKANEPEKNVQIPPVEDKKEKR